MGKEIKVEFHDSVSTRGTDEPKPPKTDIEQTADQVIDELKKRFRREKRNG